jgi:hypothetical protein
MNTKQNEVGLGISGVAPELFSYAHVVENEGFEPY